MLLRNYYTGLTNSAIGNYNVTEDVSPEISPRFSRNITGNYERADFLPKVFNLDNTSSICYGATSSSIYGRQIWFGNNTSPVTFYDYAPTGENPTVFSSTRTEATTTYDEATKTYTSVELYTITNGTTNTYPINEICLGGAYSQTSGKRVIYLRELLGENSFVLGPSESVKFELTIKYTIAEPLQ